MFARPHSDPRSVAGLYQAVRVDTGVAGASPHRLVEMLFDEFMASCSRARGAMHGGDIQGKGRAIARAVRIVEEGLRAGLNLEQGGTLAHDLHELYGYVTVRLTQANLRNDEPAIAECAALIQPLYDAWRAIAPQVSDSNTH
jgi:flagellar secretion chaperone FliS